MKRLVWVGLLCAVMGCVYPRRTTPISDVSGVATNLTGRPDDVWQLRVLSARVPPRQRSGSPWDAPDGLPDVEVRIYRADQALWTSPTVNDTLAPSWDTVLPDNVRLPRDQELRFELWDRDGVSSEPIGIYRSRGLPETALPDADSALGLDGGAQLIVRVTSPRARRGVGIRSYQMQPGGFLIEDVIPDSPAGRAGLRAGETIVAIDERRVSELGPDAAASKLSQASQSGFVLTVQGSEPAPRRVELDRNPIWLWQ